MPDSSLAVAAPSAAGLLLLDGADLRDGGVGEPRVLLGARGGHPHPQPLHRLGLLRVHAAKFLLLKGQLLSINSIIQKRETDDEIKTGHF